MPSRARKANTQLNAAKPQPLQQTPKPAQPTSTESRKPSLQSTQASATTSQTTILEPESRTGDTTESAGEPTVTPTVNRKKQKRREKEAAKRRAEQQVANGHLVNSTRPNGQPQGRGPAKGYFTEEPDLLGRTQPSFSDVGSPDDAFYSGDDDGYYEDDRTGAPDSSWLNTSKRKKTMRHKPKSFRNDTFSSLSAVRSHLPSNAALRSAHRMEDQIWNTSTQAERENIKQFWLELGEDERRSLVQVEKEAVLRKMKEQQKHSCSCSVCGRKRTAIEEELEVLYDAYYEELEQFTHHDKDGQLQIQATTQPPKHFYRRPTQPIPGSFSTRNRIQEIPDDAEDDEDFDEDEYDDEEDEPYSDEDEEEDDFDHGLPPGPTDFFQFGNSLTVKDGILTVADDLLKNDGKHFIDMMEQLAERRMHREKEVHYPSSALAHQDVHQGHNHPPLDEDDDYDDEEDDEDYDSQEDDDFEDEEMDTMTEKERMEEGRRMFQIFAARMFEQRVLTAYREKVAAERQNKLLEELDEESRLDKQREEKKAREAAKKKEKKRQAKVAKEEEKARKEAEKAAQEAAVREAEEKKLEEQKQRKEEQRKKREAERKAVDEERLRKESEKLKRQQEERERQAELERKQRESKEKERKKREDAKKKEKEEREAKEKEAREKKTREDGERKSKEDQARKEREASSKAEKDRSSQSAPKPQPVALPPGLQHASRGPSVQSPHHAVATPVVPSREPIIGRNRQSSQPSVQTHSHGSSPRSQQAASEQNVSPPSVVMPQPPGQPQHSKTNVQPPMLHHPQPSAPRSPLNNHGRGQYSFNVNGIPGLGVNGPQGAPGMMAGMMPQMPMYQNPMMGNAGRFAPGPMQYPPGFGGPRQFQPSQPLSFHSQPPMPAPVQPPQQPIGKQSHSRQPSGSTSELSSQPAPIARPGPIARPSSTTPDKQRSKQMSPDDDLENITTHLGSKALLDDSDEPVLTSMDSRTSLAPVGAPGSGRLPFSNGFPDVKQDSFGMGSQGWPGFNTGLSSGPSWGVPGQQRVSGGWSQPPFAAMAGPPPVQRSHLPRPIAVRLMLVQACRQMSNNGEIYHPVQSILRQLEMMRAPGEAPISMQEVLDIYDTEGNSQNGGGSFEVVTDDVRGQMIKFTEDNATIPRSSVGDIGSPFASHSQTSPAAIGQGFGHPGRMH